MKQITIEKPIAILRDEKWEPVDGVTARPRLPNCRVIKAHKWDCDMRTVFDNPDAKINLYSFCVETMNGREVSIVVFLRAEGSSGQQVSLVYDSGISNYDRFIHLVEATGLVLVKTKTLYKHKEK